MDMEKLNKSQIVLLTLLVSFVTSIATGIVTVSLMEQAPGAVTQTVNRIVERTVEKVAAAQPAAVSTVIEKEVFVNESEMFARAIERVAPSVVRLYMPGKDQEGKDMHIFVGFGLVTSAEGEIVADAGTPEGTLTALRADGKEVSITNVVRASEASLIRLQATSTTSNGETVAWQPVALGGAKTKLGAKVVGIGGRTSTRVASGIVTGLGGPEKEGDPSYVETDMTSETVAAGSPLLDSNGAIVGIATRESRSLAEGTFLASWAIILDNEKESPEGGAE